MQQLLTEWIFPESLLAEVSDEVDLSSFEMKDELNPDIWDGDEMKPEIRETLIKIAKDFFDSLELGIPMEDINLTGSLANYNWSRFSDVDLHILYDPDRLTPQAELFTDLLNAKSRTWNNKHDIDIKGFRVELYMQPIEQPHHSTGVYSILRNEWVTQPTKRRGEFDKANVRKKYKAIIKTIDDIKVRAKDRVSLLGVVDRN